MRALLDTNILIDYLSGVEAAREELARYRGPSISWITWMEVLVGAADEGEMQQLKAFLSGFQLVPHRRESERAGRVYPARASHQPA